MDLHEYWLSEEARRLKRLGVTHLWKEADALVTKQLSASTSPPQIQNPADPLPEQVVSAKDHDAPEPLSELPARFHGKHDVVTTLWLYPELEQDENSNDPAGRLTVLEAIKDSVCKHLGWPTHHICFCPIYESPTILQAVLKHVTPSHLLCFGDMAHIQLTATLKSTPLETAVIRLPALDLMASGDQQTKNRAWQILRNLQITFP